MSFVSVIIPAYNEEKYIADCIDTLLHQDYPQEKIEILVVDGMSTDNTRTFIQGYINKYSNIRLLDNPERFVSHALNIGIKASTGDIIIRIDVHCKYPENYISILTDKLINLKADNVGGLLKIIPSNESSVCESIAIANGHWFGVGNSRYRVGAKKITKTDTVPFGCFDRNIFARIGLFDTNLIRNQDDEFNARILKNGGSIYIIPEVVIIYYARDSIGKNTKMFFQYGFFKPLVNKKHGKVVTFRQLIPLLFTLGILSGPILSLFSPLAFLIFSIIFLCYIILSIFVSFIEAGKARNSKLVAFLPFTFLSIHISYGWGYLLGIIYFILLGEKTRLVKNNR